MPWGLTGSATELALDAATCIGCGACVAACPNGAGGYVTVHSGVAIPGDLFVSSPRGRTRTSDLPVRSRLLYPLSYARRRTDCT